MSIRPGSSVMPGRSTRRASGRHRRTLRGDAADASVGDRDLGVVDHAAGEHVDHAIGGHDHRIGVTGRGERAQYNQERLEIFHGDPLASFARLGPRALG